MHRPVAHEAVGRAAPGLQGHAYHAAMNIHLSLAPLISLIAGVLILVMPKLLNYIVAIYLIAIGVIGMVR